MDKATYRGDIDGLRAVSILLIIACHLQLPWSQGGFIGVDTFFVISGYVIHRGLKKDIEAGTLSLATFYWRRARRILPSLSITVLVTLVFATLVLTPDQLKQTSKSGAAALFFGSNLLFKNTLGYFAPEARSLPFLHTWSLGVEEQFYIVVPLLIWLATVRLKIMNLTSIVLLTTLASFMWCQFETQADPQAAFYLPMSRLWELGVGGLIAIGEDHIKTGARIGNIVGILGVAAILFALLIVDEETDFPGIAACLPVAGAALLIIAGGRGITGAALGHWLPVLVGRLSYTLYLVHWPIISLRHTYAGAPSMVDTGLMLVLMFATAALLSYFIEQPLRRVSSPSSRGGAIIAAVFFSATAAAGIFWSTNGLPQRLPANALKVASDLQLSKSRMLQCTLLTREKIPNNEELPCHYGQARRTDLVIVGDSHAGALAPDLSAELLKNSRVRGITAVTSSGCAPLLHAAADDAKEQDCKRNNAVTFEKIARWHPDVVVLVARWAVLASDVRAPGDGGKSKILRSDDDKRSVVSLSDALAETVRHLQNLQMKVLIVGPVPEVDHHVPQALTRKIWYGAEFAEGSTDTFFKRQKIVLAALENVRKMTGAAVVYPHDVLCNDSYCRSVLSGRPLYIDDDHLSSDGAKLVAPKIAKQVDEVLLTPNARVPH